MLEGEDTNIASNPMYSRIPETRPRGKGKEKENYVEITLVRGTTKHSITTELRTGKAAFGRGKVEEGGKGPPQHVPPAVPQSSLLS